VLGHCLELMNHERQKPVDVLIGTGDTTVDVALIFSITVKHRVVREIFQRFCLTYTITILSVLRNVTIM
jgi:flagellar biosynthesis GTPase FlhF